MEGWVVTVQRENSRSDFVESRRGDEHQPDFAHDVQRSSAKEQVQRHRLVGPRKDFDVEYPRADGPDVGRPEQPEVQTNGRPAQERHRTWRRSQQLRGPGAGCFIGW